MVNAPGLPRFTGPVSSSGLANSHETLDQVVHVAAGARLGAITKRVIGGLRKAWTMQLDTPRPSWGGGRGPSVLKMRATFRRSRCWRR